MHWSIKPQDKPQKATLGAGGRGRTGSALATEMGQTEDGGIPFIAAHFSFCTAIEVKKILCRKHGKHRKIKKRTQSFRHITPEAPPCSHPCHPSHTQGGSLQAGCF